MLSWETRLVKSIRPAEQHVVFVSCSLVARVSERASMASPLERQATGEKCACPSEREMEKCDPC